MDQKLHLCLLQRSEAGISVDGVRWLTKDGWQPTSLSVKRYRGRSPSEQHLSTLPLNSSVNQVKTTGQTQIHKERQTSSNERTVTSQIKETVPGHNDACNENANNGSQHEDTSNDNADNHSGTVSSRWC